GDVVEADLVVLGGRVSLEDGARLAGDLYLLSGSLDVAGVIDGDITMLNGTLRLAAGSRVEGTVDVASGLFERAPDATIVGDVTATEGLDIEGLVRAEGASPRQVLVQALVASLLLAAIAFVVAWSLPGAVSRVARTT